MTILFKGDILFLTDGRQIVFEIIKRNKDHKLIGVYDTKGIYYPFELLKKNY